MAVEFFGEVDRDDRGRIKSSYPAWYQENLITSLNDEIHNLEIRIRAMKQGKVREDQLPQSKQELRKLVERRDEIVSTKPQLDGKTKDALARQREILEREIGESMFSHSDMMRGTADPHQELKRMKSPCIKLDKGLAKDLGIELGTGGKVGRDTAIRAFKIVSRAIGAEANPEMIRRKYQKEF